jgi:NTP pyrophosphatase (non-canonical NTP hydrolase)
MQKLTEYQELLVITMEECGELIQACSKALRRQDIDDQNLRDEIGDVMCMIELMQEWDIVGWT